MKDLYKAIIILPLIVISTISPNMAKSDLKSAISNSIFSWDKFSIYTDGMVILCVC